MRAEAVHDGLDRLRRHLFDLRGQAVTEKLVNPNQLSQTRRDIARLFTVLQERGETGIEQTQHHLEAVARRSAGAK